MEGRAAGGDGGGSEDRKNMRHGKIFYIFL
jgi:hypothetical protein